MSTLKKSASGKPQIKINGRWRNVEVLLTLERYVIYGFDGVLYIFSSVDGYFVEKLSGWTIRKDAAGKPVSRGDKFAVENAAGQCNVFACGIEDFMFAAPIPPCLFGNNFIWGTDASGKRFYYDNDGETMYRIGAVILDFYQEKDGKKSYVMGRPKEQNGFISDTGYGFKVIGHVDYAEESLHPTHRAYINDNDELVVENLQEPDKVGRIVFKHKADEVQSIEVRECCFAFRMKREGHEHGSPVKKSFVGKRIMSLR